jgi:hypothetical protein
MDEIERIKRIYNRFDPHRLPSDEEYVDLEAVRSESVLGPLLKSLLFAEADQPIARLFGGGRGAGKTTELRRFERRLRDENFFALYLDVEKNVDVNNCDFIDFLFAIAYNLRTELQVAKMPGYSKIETWVSDKYNEIVGFLSQRIRVPSVELGSGAYGAQGKLQVKFERIAAPHKTLDDQFEAMAADAGAAIRELVERVQINLLEHGYRGLVLLVDGGDKIVPYRAGHDTVSQHTKIFAQRATQLCDLACHVIYSVPLSFCYSPDAQHFNATAGAQPIVLPMTSLRGEGRSEASSKTVGFDLFRQIIEHRLASVNEKIEDIFEGPALERVVLMCGGNPTALMTIIQESFIRVQDGIPLTLSTANQAVQSMANALNRSIPTEYWPVLRELAQPVVSLEKSETFLSGLYYQFIYEYMNGSSWFEVNPVIKTLDQFSA